MNIIAGQVMNVNLILDRYILTIILDSAILSQNKIYFYIMNCFSFHKLIKIV